MMAVIIGLYVAGLYNYLLFHSLAELFSIVVACGVFVVAWNTRRILDNGCLMFLGIALLFIASVDLLHLMAYKGVGIFTGYGTNLPTQLWMAGRFMQSLAFLIAPALIVKNFSRSYVLLGFLIVETLLIASIFYWRIFPTCFVEGTGLTPFKVNGEYVISGTLLLSIAYLWKKRNYFDPSVVRLLIVSIVTAILSELSFTLYTDPYGPFNMLGHIMKIITFYLLYKAIIEVGLTKPFASLFRNLKQSEERLADTLKGVTLSGIGDAVIAVDTSSSVAMMNTVAEELTGVREEYAIGKPINEVFMTSESVKQDVASPVHRVIKNNVSISLEQNTILTCQNGTKYNVDGHITPIRSARGNTMGAILVFRDITAEKQAEAERLMLADRVKLLMESTDQGIYATDLNDNLIMINKAALKMLGYERGEIIGRNTHSLIHHHHLDGSVYPEKECPITQTLAKGDNSHVDDEVFWKKDHTPFPVEYSIYPIMENSNIQGAVVAFNDITKRKQSDRLIEALSEISKDINSTLEFDEVMKKVTLKAADAIKAETARIVLLDASGWRVAYTYGFQQNEIDNAIIERDIEVGNQVLETKRFSVLDKAGDLEDSGPLLAIPLLVKNNVIGILSFSFSPAINTLPDALIDFADKLALTVSVALENARLYTAEHNISETLQSAIFSKPPSLPGIEMGYQYRSATELAKIGGDFFDLLDLGNNMVGLIIGDVSGKGLDAAAITYIVKSTLRAYAYLDSNPASVLARTNEAVKRQINNGQFITAIYATIDISTGMVEFASAGHPDPFLCTSDKCEMITACRNLPLGILSDVEFESSKITLKHDDKLILYTDGLIEAKRNGELFTDVRVKDVLMQHNCSSEPDNIALQLLKAAENFSGNNLSDDVAIVVVKYPTQNNVVDYGKLAQENSDILAGEIDLHRQTGSDYNTAA